MNCDFGENLKSILRDKLVMSVKHESIEKKLLPEDNLIYAKVKKIVFAMESAQHDAQEIQNKIVSVYKLFNSQDKVVKPNSKSNKLNQQGRPEYHLTNIISVTVLCKHKNMECRSCLRKRLLAKIYSLKQSRN